MQVRLALILFQANRFNILQKNRNIFQDWLIAANREAISCNVINN